VEDPTYFAPLCQGLVLYGADVNGNPTDDVIPVPADCVQPGLQASNDCKTSTHNFIKVAPMPAGATLTITTVTGTCVGGPPTYDCDGSGSFSIAPETCNLPPPPNGGSCVAPYVEAPDPNDPNKKICVGKGLGEQCMPGFNYDPLLQCCSAVNPGPNQYGICGAGFYQQGNACVPAQGNPPALQTVIFNFAPIALCPNTGGGDDGGSCPPITCGGRTPKFCASTCSCVPSTSPCP
jgi:hypothetical protein